MPTKYTSAGADAAGDYDEQFRQIIQNDPDVQRVIQGVWGNTPLNERPSDTPKHLEKANDAASKQITQILKAKGIPLPDRTFVNPRSGNLEGHRGWKGLSGLQKAAIIAAAGAAGIGGAAALGAFGGAAAAGGSGAAAASATPGVTAGLGGATFGTTVPVATGGNVLGGMLTSAGLNAAKTKLTGGSWGDAALSAGLGAATGGAGGNMSLGSVLGGFGKDLAKDAGGSLMQQLLSGRGLSGAGNGLASVSATQANNRGAKLEAMLAGDEMGLASDRERRADELQMMKQMQIADYIKSGGAKETMPSVSASGKPFTKFDFGVRPTTEAEQDMAGALQNSMMERAKNPRKLSDYASQMDPGKLEQISGFGGAALSALGAARQQDTSPLMQLLSGLNRQPSATPTTTTPQAAQLPPIPTPSQGSADGFVPLTPRPSGNPFSSPDLFRSSLG